MSYFLRCIAPAFLCVVTLIAKGAELYECKNDQGNSLFTDNPEQCAFSQQSTTQQQHDLITDLAAGSVRLRTSRQGDHFVYRPRPQPHSILVIAHGMTSKKGNARSTAETFIKRWVDYADENRLLLIAPVFDSPRFANRAQHGYGGYRNLFGKYVGADSFVNHLVDRYAPLTTKKSGRFYLYGHSAGGQFANRYLVTHPKRIKKAVISAAGRYTYPTKSAAWPYGAGDLTKTVQWNDGRIKRREQVSTSLQKYALAASKPVAIIIGAKDNHLQPNRPAQTGSNRIEFAQGWAKAMNANAQQYGLNGRISIKKVPGVGHNSAKLTPASARFLFGDG